MAACLKDGGAPSDRGRCRGSDLLRRGGPHDGARAPRTGHLSVVGLSPPTSAAFRRPLHAQRDPRVELREGTLRPVRSWRKWDFLQPVHSPCPFTSDRCSLISRSFSRRFSASSASSAGKSRSRSPPNTSAPTLRILLVAADSGRGRNPRGNGRWGNRGSRRCGMVSERRGRCRPRGGGFLAEMLGAGDKPHLATWGFGRLCRGAAGSTGSPPPRRRFPTPKPSVSRIVAVTAAKSALE